MNGALAPVSVPPVRVAVIVEAAPLCVSVTLWLASTPAVNAALVVRPAEPIRFDVTSTGTCHECGGSPVACTAIFALGAEGVSALRHEAMAAATTTARRTTYCFFISK